MTPTGTPPPAYTQYVYDAANDALVGWSASPRIAAGDTPTGTTRETWLLPMSTMTWTKAASVAGGQTVPADTVYVGYAMAYDPVRQQTLLHSLTGNVQLRPHDLGLPISDPRHAPASAAARPTPPDRRRRPASRPPGWRPIRTNSTRRRAPRRASRSRRTRGPSVTGPRVPAPRLRTPMPLRARTRRRLTVTDSNGSATTVSKSVTATVPVVTPPPPPPPPPPAPPPTNVPPYTGKITSFALPAIEHRTVQQPEGQQAHQHGVRRQAHLRLGGRLGHLGHRRHVEHEPRRRHLAPGCRRPGLPDAARAARAAGRRRVRVGREPRKVPAVAGRVLRLRPGRQPDPRVRQGDVVVRPGHQHLPAGARVLRHLRDQHRQRQRRRVRRSERAHRRVRGFVIRVRGQALGREEPGAAARHSSSAYRNPAATPPTSRAPST